MKTENQTSLAPAAHGAPALAPAPGSASVEREQLRINAACAARSLGVEKEYAHLMAMFEKAKAML